MHRFHFHRLGLCEAASESGSAEPSGAATPPATDDPPATPPAAEPATQKVGAVAAIRALARGANGNAAMIANLESQVTSLTTERDQARATITERDQMIAGLQGQITTLQGQVTQLQTSAKAVEDALAEIGVSQENLPAQAQAAAATLTAQEIFDKAEAETDPMKKGQLSREAMKVLTAEQERAKQHLLQN